MTGPATVPAERMRQLIEAGDAVALLAGHFPVPSFWGGRWWHIPLDQPPDHYLPAGPDHAARYERLAARRRLASALIARDDPHRLAR